MTLTFVRTKHNVVIEVDKKHYHVKYRCIMFKSCRVRIKINVLIAHVLKSIDVATACALFIWVINDIMRKKANV